ncbi:hypothetical protein K474DRAFT_198280 [Panus rudis PR-1116 ss-1]|nr:hypothetical protein K474DRAFT_198280 [Panus rudis PR-1116 ss-1]
MCTGCCCMIEEDDRLLRCRPRPQRTCEASSGNLYASIFWYIKMSIDLEWSKLDSSLANSLVEILNRQLSTTSRPSFIGPIEVSSLDFGSASPDVELVDMRDIYRDFLEDDETEEPERDAANTKAAEANGIGGEDDDYEWVSRRAARAQSLPEDLPAYHLLPPHMRDIWNPALSNLVDLRPTYPYASGYASPMYRSASLRPPLAPVLSQRHDSWSSSSPILPISASPEKSSPPPERQVSSDNTRPKPNTHPNLQLHFRIVWNSNLRLTFTTSLLINYPSPMFMSLPIKLSVTGLLFDGEVVVAYEGERRRVHLCIVDDLDPYCPLATERPKRETPPSATPPDPEDEAHTPGVGAMPMTMSMSGQSTGSRAGKPLPIGQRLLPSIYIESEIGQADKHVLKNVTRVEKFIQDVIRKTIEEELVFPNFHTLVLAEPE